MSEKHDNGNIGSAGREMGILHIVVIAILLNILPGTGCRSANKIATIIKNDRTEYIIVAGSDDIYTNFAVGEFVEIVRKSTQTYMKNIIDYCSDPVVSSDIIGRPESCVFDSLSTKVIGGNTVQLIAWYDNEFGYSNRLVDLIIRLGR